MDIKAGGCNCNYFFLFTYASNKLLASELNMLVANVNGARSSMRTH